ncbi:hypothetical protein [Nocardia arthritidis]|uniref:hypothetical protein n=1 Tax=Nocardia arthritidis TaxID=228602 RepID=UPI0007A3E750|nr:hypothetical protein [Nocardia arthritidis]
MARFRANGPRHPVGLGKFAHQHGSERAGARSTTCASITRLAGTAGSWATGEIIVLGGVAGCPESFRRRRDGMVG